jgi:hypothetical protein
VISSFDNFISGNVKSLRLRKSKLSRFYPLPRFLRGVQASRRAHRKFARAGSAQCRKMRARFQSAPNVFG